MKTSDRLNWVAAAIGVWMIAAPYVLGYAEVSLAVLNSTFVGAALIAVAVWSALTTDPSTARVLDWTNVAIGGWLILAPFILGYADVAAALWNALIVGIVVAGLDAWAALAIRSRGTIGRR